MRVGTCALLVGFAACRTQAAPPLGLWEANGYLFGPTDVYDSACHDLGSLPAGPVHLRARGLTCDEVLCAKPFGPQSTCFDHWNAAYSGLGEDAGTT